MKKLMLAAAAGLLCFSQAAMAEIRTYEFTASVGQMLLGDSPVQTWFGWDGSGNEVTVGDKIVGRFSYDDAEVPWGETGVFTKVIDASLSFTFKSSGMMHATTTGKAVAVSDEVEGVRSFSVTTLPAGDLYQAALFFGKIEDPSNPYPGGLGELPDRGFIMNWGYNGETVNLHAMVNSVTQVSSVPEPATWGMLLGGLGLVGLAARRSRPAA